MKKVFSFDIYDTCITRIFAYPTDLFLELAHRVLQKKGNVTDSSVHTLANFRIQVEKRARLAHKPREDIKIDKIYEQFTELAQWGIKPQDMLEQELLLERQSTYPILEIKRRIEELRRQNRRIIFISDMYLPVDFIRGFLQDFGIAMPKDAIYVSSEIGLLKESGRLFKYVLEEEGILPEQLEHVGDNLSSDIRIPRKMGITAVHYTDAALNRYEKKVRLTNHHNPKILSKIAGTSRITRLRSDHDISSLVTGVIAPFLTAYTAWVLKTAHKQGIQRLYFVSRDGQVLYEIAQRFIRQRTGFPECRYLYGSRQAWFLPSLTSCNKKSLDWLIYRHDSKSPREILKKLNISPEEITEHLKKIGIYEQDFDNQLDEAGVERFWLLLETPAMSQLVLEKAAIAREIAFDYFRQEGLLLDAKWALVDTGWRLTSQRALKRILNYKRENTNVHGYYLAVRKDRVNEVGTFSAFISAVEGHALTGKKYSWLFDQGTASVIEELFTMSDHPPLMGYERVGNRVEPVLSTESGKLKDHNFFKILRCSILYYAEEISKTNTLDSDLEIFMQSALESAGRFFTSPRKEDIEAISWLPVDIEQLHDPKHSRRLASPLTFLDLTRMVGYLCVLPILNMLGIVVLLLCQTLLSGHYFICFYTQKNWLTK